ncbi:MAG: glycerate kinase [Methylococcales bacterium]|nr:glycerate kinase [Methylococcales bacterium]
MGTSTHSLRKNALRIFQAGIDAANPYQAVKNCLTIAENHIEIALDLDDTTKKRCGRWSKIHVIAFGKAACSMAKAAEELIPDHRLAYKPIAITNYENETVLNNIKVMVAGHPLPDGAGQKAAEFIAEKIKNAEKDELVLLLISGGGSALIPYPASGITLEDKQTTTDLLLASGANINQINCVRKHLSQIKGGHLARLSTPADLHALILSDVVGNDFSSIASGPTVPDNTTFADAIGILKEKDIWDKTPVDIKSLLKKGFHGETKETPKPGDSCFKKTSHTLIGSNTISLNGLVKAANNLGYNTNLNSQPVCGEARNAAKQLVLHALKKIETGLTQATAILSGGETTVTLNGTGSGGRNQEMALTFAIAEEKHPLKGKWTFLSAGTDGRDGPTDAAGGIVDAGTLGRIRKARANPENRLNNNDSYSALKKSQDLVITGATGTNVADLQVLLIQPE